MRKLKRTLPIILPFAILGMFAVSGHAKKPAPLPVPTVTVTGVINTECDPKAICVKFDSSLAFQSGAFLPSVHNSFIHSTASRLHDCLKLMLASGRNAFSLRISYTVWSL